LVQGESGTGKEVVARFIHRASARKDGPSLRSIAPLCPSNSSNQSCSATNGVPFTGAQQSKVGQIELASHGVLFLDEITEMSLSAQAKFLRALQEHEFQRLGARGRSSQRPRDRGDQP